MVTNEKVLEAFPAPKFRPYQESTLKAINSAFNSGIKVVLLEAPTGSGKSILNTTFCNLLISLDHSSIVLVNLHIPSFLSEYIHSFTFDHLSATLKSK